MTTWQQRARELADEIEASGMQDPVWRDALESVPRHVFVPRFYEQQPDTTWTETTPDAPGWLEAVYHNSPLITELAATGNGGQVTVSSSSKPGLMLRMLEALDLHDGHRVLEIGTGTGYNAGLLCHRLGDDQVVSIDIGAEMVRTARDRLASLGYNPQLIAGDGSNGVPEHAPYNRIIATCAVPRVPSAWADQLCDGGLLLADIKPSGDAGNLALLHKEGNQLRGRLLPQWAGFMGIRTADTAPEPAGTGTSEAVLPPSASSGARAEGEQSRTSLSAFPWDSLIPWFLAQSAYPSPVGFGLREITETGPQWTSLTTSDGSWAHIRIAPASDGTREVRQGGPLRLWDALEAAYQDWTDVGRPDWQRFGLTVQPGGMHTVWLDRPDSTHQWVLQGHR